MSCLFTLTGDFLPGLSQYATTVAVKRREEGCEPVRGRVWRVTSMINSG